MARSEARAAAMKLLYERTMGGEGGENTIVGMLELTPDADEAAYIADVLSGVERNAEAIDETISNYTVGWTLERMARVDLSILRVAVYEMLYRPDIPGPASINEALELARTYSTEEAVSFINGVLGSLARAQS